MYHKHAIPISLSVVKGGIKAPTVTVYPHTITESCESIISDTKCDVHIALNFVRDQVTGSLGNRDHNSAWMPRSNAREHRGIDNSETIDAVHL